MQFVEVAHNQLHQVVFSGQVKGLRSIVTGNLITWVDGDNKVVAKRKTFRKSQQNLVSVYMLDLIPGAQKLEQLVSKFDKK